MMIQMTQIIKYKYHCLIQDSSCHPCQADCQTYLDSYSSSSPQNEIRREKSIYKPESSQFSRMFQRGSSKIMLCLS